MKKLFLMTFAISVLLPPVVQAGWKSCEVDVYQAYSTAVKRGWHFSCSSKLALTPEPPKGSQKGRLACQGTGDLKKKNVAYFFKKDWQSSPKFKNGWRLNTYEVSGGNFNKLAKQKVRVSFYWLSKVKTKRSLSKLVLEKENGDCSKVYDEAF